MTKRLIGFMIGVSLLLPAVGFARWADPKEAYYEVSRKVNVQVKADGTSRMVVEERRKILTEVARKDYGYFQFYYTPSRERFRILTARTIRGKQSYPVKPELFQDKSVATNGFDGFDEQRQLTIVYPRVEIGSELYIKYAYEERRPIVPGWFQHKLWGSGEYVTALDVTVRSEKPLKLFVRDPDKIFKIERKKQSGQDVVRVRNYRPYYYHVVEEKNSRRIAHLAPVVMATTFTDWRPVADYFADFIDRQANEPIPPKMAKILAEARGKKTEKEKIDTVMNGVMNLVRYVGDWRTYEGSYFPRGLALIEKTGFGDCKDYSYSVMRLLKELGFEAYWSLVYRNSDSDEQDLYDIPVWWFNHAFVHVKGKEREYWLEPTDSIVFSQSVPIDSENRHTLVVKKGEKALARTPVYTADDSVARYTTALSKTENPKELRYKGKAELLGRRAVQPTRLGLQSTAENWKYDMMADYVIGDMNQVSSWDMFYDGKLDRIVKDIVFDYEYVMKDGFLSGSTGPAFVLETPSWVGRLFMDHRNRVLDIVIGPAGTDEYVWELPRKEISGKPPSECLISNEWITARRKVESERDKLRITDTYKVHRDILPIAVLKSAAFQAEVGKVKECFRNYAFVWN